MGILEVPSFCIQHQPTIKIHDPLCSLRAIDNSLSARVSITTRQYSPFYTWPAIITLSERGPGGLARERVPEPRVHHALPEGQHRGGGSVDRRGAGCEPRPGRGARGRAGGAGAARRRPGREVRGSRGAAWSRGTLHRSGVLILGRAPFAGRRRDGRVGLGAVRIRVFAAPGDGGGRRGLALPSFMKNPGVLGVVLGRDGLGRLRGQGLLQGRGLGAPVPPRRRGRCAAGDPAAGVGVGPAGPRGGAGGPAEVAPRSLHLAVLGQGRGGVLTLRPGTLGLRGCAVAVASTVSALGVLVRILGRRGRHPSGARRVGRPSLGGRVLPFGRARPGVVRPSGGQLRFGGVALLARIRALLRILRLRGQSFVPKVPSCPRPRGPALLRGGRPLRRVRPSLGAPQGVRGPGGGLPGGGRRVVAHLRGRKWLFVFRFALPPGARAQPRVGRGVGTARRVRAGGRGRRGAGGLQPGSSAVAEPVRVPAVGCEGPASVQAEVSRAHGQPRPERLGGDLGLPPRRPVATARRGVRPPGGLCPRGEPRRGRGRLGGARGLAGLGGWGLVTARPAAGGRRPGVGFGGQQPRCSPVGRRRSRGRGRSA